MLVSSVHVEQNRSLSDFDEPVAENELCQVFCRVEVWVLVVGCQVFYLIKLCKVNLGC